MYYFMVIYILVYVNIFLVEKSLEWKFLISFVLGCCVGFILVDLFFFYCVLLGIFYIILIFGSFF